MTFVGLSIVIAGYLISAAIEKFAEGWTVTHLHAIGKGCPDLLVGVTRFNVKYNFLLEVKDGNKSWKLTPDQVIWHYNWQGQVDVVTSPQNAVETIKKLLKEGK